MMVDTLTIARGLKAAELPAGQTEAIATARAATRSDLAQTELRLEAKID